MRHFAVLGILFTIGVAVAAPTAPSSPQFTSGAAKEAWRKYERALITAQAEYGQRVTAAKRLVVRELEAAKDKALISKNLDEANIINAAIKDLKSDVAASQKTDRSPRAVTQGVWEYRLGRNKSRPMILDQNGNVADWRAGYERYWRFEDGNLVIGDETQKVELHACDDGGWRGILESTGEGVVLKRAARPAKVK